MLGVKKILIILILLGQFLLQGILIPGISTSAYLIVMVMLAFLIFYDYIIKRQWKLSVSSYGIYPPFFMEYTG